MLVWSFDATVTFNDGTTKSIAILNDLSQGKRTVGDTDSEAMLLDRLSRDSNVENLVTALGYTPKGLTQESDVKEIIFRFMAIVTSTGIYVAGSNTKLSTESIVESNDLTEALTLLNADTDFVTLLGTDLGS